ncbi:hypothetical protein RJ641_006581, partial [Dillenia turbinata]
MSREHDAEFSLVTGNCIFILEPCFVVHLRTLFRDWGHKLNYFCLREKLIQICFFNQPSVCVMLYVLKISERVSNYFVHGCYKLFDCLDDVIHAGDAEALAEDAKASPRRRLVPEILLQLARK